MNYRKIASRVAREIVSARRVVAGMVQPPPAMVEDIYRWSAASVAVNTLLVTMNYRKNIEAALSILDSKGIEKDWDFIVRNGNPESIDRDEFFKEQIYQRKQYERRAREADEDIKQSRKVLKLYPRLSLKRWDRKKKSFKVDLKGWRYSGLLKEAEEKYLKAADFLFGVVKVELAEGNLQGNAKAYWKSSSSILRIQTGGDLKNIIEHELVHWAQAYMNIALQTRDFGRPPKKMRTPEYGQNIKAPVELKRKMKQVGLKEEDIHDLDDVEFYTELIGVVDMFKQYRKKPSMKSMSDVDIFKDIVGQDGEAESIFFQRLQRGSRAKWQKAVKELAKAVL